MYNIVHPPRSAHYFEMVVLGRLDVPVFVLVVLVVFVLFSGYSPYSRTNRHVRLTTPQYSSSSKFFFFLLRFTKKDNNKIDENHILSAFG